MEHYKHSIFLLHISVCGQSSSQNIMDFSIGFCWFQLCLTWPSVFPISPNKWPSIISIQVINFRHLEFYIFSSGCDVFGRCRRNCGYFCYIYLGQLTPKPCFMVPIHSKIEQNETRSILFDPIRNLHRPRDFIMDGILFLLQFTRE